MISTDNATYTYRGFRLQALYALYKIFTSSHSYTFQPEGAEDLAIFDNNKKLIEAIQVKSGNNSLSLSDFKNSFFERLVHLQSTNPDICIYIVKFGPIGIELKNACNKDGVERQNVINKLLSKENFKCNKNQLENLFNSMKTMVVIEKEIYQNIDDVLKDSLLGINKDHAFDLLTKWIYDLSEEQGMINQSILKDKIINISKFLKGRESYHKKWFSVIQPIEFLEINEKQKESLAISYYQGESAKISHIHLNLDVKRLSKLTWMQKLHSEQNILFIHGASGQGKSTLAYRYLHEFYPETWCFEIKLTENRMDALESALAISEHASALDTPIFVYMDVSPHDSGWEELVKALSNHPKIKVLITIREEDWKKSYITGVDFSFHDIELEFNENEAEEIFKILFHKQSINHYLNFTDAWNAFGNKGSLLEFVYLITQGGKLKERLQSQIDRLIDENNNSIISVLRCIAVATASGARLNVKKTIQHFQIPPEKLFKRLESEYFLRIDESKRWIEAYHPLRSVILEEILIDEGYAPWIEQFQIVWSLVHDEDVGMILLHALINHFNKREDVFFTVLLSNPNNWISIEKIIQALIWLSVRGYIENNLDYIRNIFNTPEGHFVLTVGADIIKIGNESWKDIINSDFIPEEKRIKCIEIHNKLEIDNFQLHYLILYLLQLPSDLSIPKTDEEWYALSKTMLWLCKCSIINDVSFIDKNTLEQAEIKSIKIASHFATSLYLAYPKSFLKWQSLNRKIILERLCKKENVIGIEETEENIKAHFLTFDLTIDQDNKHSDDEENIVHAKTMAVIDILHKLFPEKKVISSQGYGHLLSEMINHDESVKSIPVENLHTKEFVEVNAMFLRITNNFFRPETWNDYVEDVMMLRQKILEYLKITISLLEQYFHNKQAIDPLRKSGAIEKWNELDSTLKQQILLPITAVDKWGFFDEDSIFIKGSIEINNINLSIKRYASIQKVLRDYKTNLGNFFLQAASVFDINAFTGKLSSEERNNLIQKFEMQNFPVNHLHLSWINLLESINNIPVLQKEFDNIFSELTEYKLNKDLKNQEKLTIERLGQLWYFFAYNPNIKTKRAQKELTKRFEDRKKNLLNEVLLLLNTNETRTKFSFLEKNPDKQNNHILYIKVENDSALQAWYICFESIMKTSKYIHNLTPFAKTVLEWYWKKILFIPIANTYTINNFIIPMPTNHLLLSSNEEEINPLQHIPKKLSKSECGLLKLSQFSSSTATMINEIFDLTSKLFGYVSHIKDLKNLPDNLNYGEKVLTSYVKNINIVINDSINVVINKLTVLQEYIKEKSENENDIYLDVVSELSNFWTHLYPDSIFEDKDELNMKELQIWSDELQQAIGSLMSLYPLVMDLD